MFDVNLKADVCAVLLSGDMSSGGLSPSSRGTLEMIIGQSVIQNGLVMALVSVVVSLYVIGLQRVRVQPRTDDPGGPVHEPLGYSPAGRADKVQPTATSHDPQ